MLTRPRRQILATLAMLGTTVVPTIFISATAFRLNRPEHLREVESEIGRRLGALVKVASATHPRPGYDVLGGVTLRLDRAENAEMARADVLEIQRDSGDLVLKIPRLQLRGETPSAALGQVEGLMRRFSSGDSEAISLSADAVTLDLGAFRIEVKDLAAIFRREESTSSITASYLIADEKSGAKSRCEMVLRRSASAEGPRTSLAFKTMDGPVPARVLGPFFDTSGWVGASALVEGSLSLSQVNAGEWKAEFRGDVLSVDLAKVFGRRFPGHRLSGLARLGIEIATWSERPEGQGSGWTEARGTLSAGQGSISPSLIRSLASEMSFRIPASADLRPLDVEFQGLGLSFALDRSGELLLGGSLGGDYAPDAVLIQGHRSTPLVKSPEGTGNVRGLWKALIAAPANAMAPAVPESQVLRYLPLPHAEVGRLNAN